MTIITNIFALVGEVFTGLLAQMTTFIEFVLDPANAILWVGFALMIIGIVFKLVKRLTKM